MGAWDGAQKLGFRADSSKFGMSLGVRVYLAEWEEADVQWRRQRQVWRLVYNWVLAGPYLRISAAGVHISCVQAVLGVPPCCVVVVSKESRFAVRERKGRWGKEKPFVLVKLLEVLQE